LARKRKAARRGDRKFQSQNTLLRVKKSEVLVTREQKKRKKKPAERRKIYIQGEEGQHSEMKDPQGESSRFGGLPSKQTCVGPMCVLWKEGVSYERDRCNKSLYKRSSQRKKGRGVPQTPKKNSSIRKRGRKSSARRDQFLKKGA